jgi:hypothetical protein
VIFTEFPHVGIRMCSHNKVEDSINKYVKLGIFIFGVHFGDIFIQFKKTQIAWNLNSVKTKS